MAEKLLQYYKYIYDVKGLDGRIQLAKKTNIPTPRAALEKDTPDTVDRFRRAIKEITGTEAPKY